MADSAMHSIQCAMLGGLASEIRGKERADRSMDAQEKTSGSGQIVPGEGTVPEFLGE